MEVHYVFTVYGALGNNYAGMGGYSGKDWSCLTQFFDLFDVPTDCRPLVFSILSWLDTRNIEKSAAEAKRAAKTK